MRPPGRSTRASSWAVTAWRGANMHPKVERTTSKLSSSSGRSSASPWTHSTSHPGLRGQAPAGGEELGREVDADDAGARLGRAQRRVAGPAGDVEDILAGTDADGLDDPRSDLPELAFGDRREVAGGPGCASALLEHSELRQCCRIRIMRPRLWTAAPPFMRGSPHLQGSAAVAICSSGSRPCCIANRLAVARLEASILA